MVSWNCINHAWYAVKRHFIYCNITCEISILCIHNMYEMNPWLHFQGLKIARCDKQIAKIKEIITTYLYLYQRMWVSRGLRLSHKISHMCIFWKGRRDITTLEYGSITHTCKTQIKCSFRSLDRDSHCSDFKV